MIKLRLEIFLDSQHNFDRNATNHISTSLVLLNAWTQRKLLQFGAFEQKTLALLASKGKHDQAEGGFSLDSRSADKELKAVIPVK